MTNVKAGLLMLLGMPLLTAAATEVIEVRGIQPAAWDRLYSDALTSEEIDSINSVTLADLLLQLPGVDGSPTAAGTPPQLFIQGLPASRWLIMLDGVPLHSATLGSADLSFIETASLARVEILAGSLSSLYGSHGMAGVILLTTHKDSSRLALQTGTHGLAAISANVAGTIAAQTRGRIGFSLRSWDGVDQRALPGTEDNDGLFQYTLSAGAEHELDNDWRLQWQGRAERQRRDYDNRCYDSQSFALVDCQPELDQRSEQQQLSASRRADNGRDQLQLSYWSNRVADRDTVLPAGSWYGQNDSFATRRWHLSAQQQRLWQRDSAREFDVGWGLSVVDESASGSAVSYQQDERTVTGIFGHAGVQHKALGTQLSWRVEDAAGQALRHAVSWRTAWSPAGAGLWSVELGSGFQRPGFNDLYWPQGGNPNLEDETSYGLQLQWQHEIKGTAIKFSGYLRQLDNLIQWVPDSSGWYSAQNTEEAELRGLRLELRRRIGRIGVSSSINFADSSDGQGDQLPFRAREFGQLQLDYQIGAWNWLWDMQYRGSRIGNQQQLSGYLHHDLRAEGPVARSGRLTVSIQNLFNTDVEWQSGWRVPERQLRLQWLWNW
ncbi:TonB-dependent receptor plug domain-containing protein [Pseudidiomarina sp.]|uniref:TonB-dependent receptor plug domain-containing protein n=1 Tax=Pseudidiomarina sp. TaxID=2081707 RepID=UPI00299F1714|nr:TonB-dependent receptor [Pseudidiomarina sp.]MDX1706246.1 TonB-dependent receptor [Pseudidiomarina sp.]